MSNWNKNQKSKALNTKYILKTDNLQSVTEVNKSLKLRKSLKTKISKGKLRNRKSKETRKVRSLRSVQKKSIIIPRINRV